MTQTYALVGHPLGFSLSPAMHNAAFEAHGIDARYILRPTAPGDLPDVMEALRAGDLDGVNVTVPHKVAAALLIEDESGVVRRVGAVNTIMRDDAGFWRGENTDATGFLHVLRKAGMDQGRGSRAVVLGAGGAARAVVGVLLQAGYAVDVHNRSSARAAVLVSHLDRHFPGAILRTALFDEAAIRTAVLEPGGGRSEHGVTVDGGRPALVVNATSLGAWPSSTESPWPLDTPWPADVKLIDLIAWPPETALVRHALGSGAEAQGGLEMLVAQAAAAFRLWTGHAAPLRTMRKAAIDAMKSTAGEPEEHVR